MNNKRKLSTHCDVTKHGDVKYEAVMFKGSASGFTLNYEKVRQGLLSSWQYQCKTESELAKTHVLTDVKFQQTYGNVSSLTCAVRTADLDPIANRYILAGKADGTLSVYDTSGMEMHKQTITLLASRKEKLRNYGYPNQINCVQWYPVDAGLFTSTCSHRPSSVDIWDPNTMRRVDEFGVSCLVCHHHMSPVESKNSLLAAAGSTGEVILCDLRTGSSSHRVHGHSGPVAVVQWTRHNPNHLASGGQDGTVRIWDVRSGRACLKILSDAAVSSKTFKKRVNPSSRQPAVTSLTFSHDGLWLVSYSYNGYLKVWDTLTYRSKEIGFGRGLSYRYTSVKKVIPVAITRNLYPDIIYVPSRLKILVYEISTGQLVNVLQGHFDNVVGTIYNPRTADVYSYGTDLKFLVWSPGTFVRGSGAGAADAKLGASSVAANSWSSDEDDK